MKANSVCQLLALQPLTIHQQTISVQKPIRVESHLQSYQTGTERNSSNPAYATCRMLLPAPRHSTSSSTSFTTSDPSSSSSNLQLTSQSSTSIPQYGRRKNWKPRKQEEFGDGGAYPECHLAQYPLEMGRKKQVSSPSCSPRFHSCG